MTAAGIVVYHPNRERLLANLEQTGQQVERIFVFCNELDSVEWLRSLDKVEVIPSDGENHGIAYACNRIVECATELGAKWCLLLDQDSIIPDGMVHSYEEYLTKLGVDNYGKPHFPGILTCKIWDSRSQVVISEESERVRFCITSGSYVNTKVWKEIGGYREEYFIDLVDQEYCARVYRQSYSIINVPGVVMNHELGAVDHTQNNSGNSGESENPINLNNKSKLQLKDAYTYSAFRRYYITRNRILFAYEYPEFKEFGHPYLKAWKRALAIVLYEDDKFRKLRAICHGVRDAKKIISGEKLENPLYYAG